MSAITIGGELIHYEVLGRGRPVMLLHSWVGSWRYWVPTMQQLQLKFRVYSLDFHGFGDTSKNPQKYTLDHQVQLVHDFMNAMAIPKAAFIGHGLGALVTAEFARLYSDKAPRGLLISAPLFDPGNLDKRVPAGRSVALTTNKPAAPEVRDDATIMNSSSAMRAALLERARAIGTGEAPPTPPAVAEAVVEKQARHNPLQTIIGSATPESLLQKCFKRSETPYEKLAVDLLKTDQAALKGSVSAFDSGRMLDTLRLLTMPVVLLHGADDPLMTAPTDSVLNYITADKDESMLPIPLQGVRHFPMLEYERFGRLVSEFLEIADLNKLEVKERWKRRTR